MAELIACGVCVGVIAILAFIGKIIVVQEQKKKPWNISADNEEYYHRDTAPRHQKTWKKDSAWRNRMNRASSTNTLVN